MKKILFIVVLFSCSENEPNSPVFRVEDVYFESRIEKFVNIAKSFDVAVPQNNMILRFVDDDNIGVNDSKTYTKDGQRYIDIDRKFKDGLNLNGNQAEMLVFQQLANGLLGTAFRDCGIMKKINVPDDVPPAPTWDYDDYRSLVDSVAPCVD